MLQMARKGEKGNMTLIELSQKEALTPAYVAKIMGVLRKGGLVKSIRGQSGGYQLSRPAHEIDVNEVLEVLGGKFFSREEYCSTASSDHHSCIHSMDCAIRSLWTGLEQAISGYLRKCKLSDLVTTEMAMEKWLGQSNPKSFVPIAAVGGNSQTPRVELKRGTP